VFLVLWAKTRHENYLKRFPQYKQLRRKAIFPFIY
jgi:hypothetical protein